MPATIQTIQKPTRARALDTSGNNNHGQIYSGRALEFDGVTDYLNAGTGVDLGTGDFTISAWVYLNAIGADENLFYKKQDSSNRWYFVINSSGKLVFWSRQGGSTKIEDGGSTTFIANTWYRVVVSADRDSFIKLYINGVLDGTGSGNTDTIDNTGALAIGLNGTAGGTYMDGMMSDAQIWDAAWTADDVLYDYNNPEQLALNRGGTSLTESNLKLWYPMNDGHRGQQSYILDASNTGLGDEMITPQVNRDFNGANNWSEVNNAVVTTVDGKLNINCPASTDYVNLHRDYVADLKAGSSYKYEFTLSDISAGACILQLDGGVNIATGLGNGTHTIYHTGTSGNALNGEIRILPDTSGGVTFKIDNFSLKPVNDKNHATTVFYGDDLGTNGAFSSDTSGWTALNSATLSSESGGQAGNCLKILRNGVNNPNTYSTNIPVVAGRTYKFSFYHKDIDSTSKNPTWHVYDVTNAAYTSEVGDDTAITANANWTEVTANVVAPSGCENLRVGFKHVTTTADAYYFDTVTVKEEGTASGWTDADQQLDIPQTALQSYNQLAWFDGVADYVSIGDHNDLSFDTLSISTWINMNDATDFPIFGKGIYNSTAEYQLKVQSDDKIHVWVADESETDCHIGRSTPVVTAYENKWIHVVATYDGGTTSSGLKIYINGEQVDDANDEDNAGSFVAMENLGADAHIGRYGGLYANGAITEVSTWQIVLTQEAIDIIYNNGLALDLTTYATFVVLGKGYWRNNGLSTWENLKGNSDGTPQSLTETMLITAGVDGSRDSQGFLMNRQKATNSLNLTSFAEDDPATFITDHDHVKCDNFGANYDVFSICCWVKTNYIGENGHIIDNRVSASKGWIVYVITDGSFKFKIGDGSDTLDLDSGSDLTIDTWHHLAVTYAGNAGAVKMYFDGVYKNTADATDVAVLTTMSDLAAKGVTIGARNHGSGTESGFHGEIDDVLYYSKVLSDGGVSDEATAKGEIARIYNAGKRSHR